MRFPMLLPLALATLSACAGGESDTTIADTARGETAVAVATSPAADPAASALVRGTAPMRDSAGKDLGTLTLTEAAAGITITGMLTGLPAGSHGIHLHGVGKCEPPFTSAGDHWNPTSRQHGLENAQGAHLGDMPNLPVGATGAVDVQISTKGGGLQGQHPLLDGDGGAVVIHAGPDDQRTDPSGNSGARIACGVVTLAAPAGS